MRPTATASTLTGPAGATMRSRLHLWIDRHYRHSGERRQSPVSWSTPPTARSRSTSGARSSVGANQAPGVYNGTSYSQSATIDARMRTACHCQPRGQPLSGGAMSRRSRNDPGRYRPRVVRRRRRNPRRCGYRPAALGHPRVYCRSTRRLTSTAATATGASCSRRPRGAGARGARRPGDSAAA
jgi:hypothetical protein